MKILHLVKFIGIAYLIFASSCKTVEKFPQKADNLLGSHLAINGTTLYVNTCGKGEPMIVIHGGPGLDHSYMLPQMLGLSDKYKLIFYDQRACGKSVSDDPISMDLLIEDIEGIRDNLGFDSIHVLGHSWGGLLAMKYAIKYPQKTTSLILLNSMAYSDTLRSQELAAVDSSESQFYQKKMQEVMSSEAFKNQEANAYEDLFRVIFEKEFYDPLRVSELTLDFPDNFAENSKKLQALGPDLAKYDLGPDLLTLDLPALIIYGVKEPAANIVGPELWDKLDNSELVVLPRCGHFPFIEQPTKLFEAIIDFTNSI